MQVKKIVLLVIAAMTLLLAVGCGFIGLIPEPQRTKERAGAGRGPYGSQRDFAVTGNPLINSADNFTGDPSATVVKDPQTGKEILLLVTSSDSPTKPNQNFTMDNIYLYTTGAESLVGTAAAPVIYHGSNVPIVEEKNVPWLNKSQPLPSRLYAPDIQYVPGSTTGGEDRSDRLLVYFPDFIQGAGGSNDIKGMLRIGMAYTNYNTDALFGPYEFEPGPFIINDTVSKKVPNNGYAYDPGVFYSDPAYRGDGEYYMAYCNTKSELKIPNTPTLGMVRINNRNFNEGDYLGEITFTNANAAKDDNGQNLNVMYEEGPDLNIMTTPNGTVLYYLVFAAKVHKDEDEYIGYATATPEEFHANPAGCWTFRGWIFKNLFDGGWTNHADLVQYNNRTYIFFHEILPGNTRRQAYCREIELRDDGRIVGVEPNNFDALDPWGKSIGKGHVWMRDNSMNDRKKTSVFLSYFTNKTGSTLTNFSFKYFVRVEPGRNLVADNVWFAKDSGRYKTSLEHVYSKIWAVKISYSGTLEPDQSLGDISFNVRYSGGEDMDKLNDFSLPRSQYNSWSDRIPIYNAQGVRVAGVEPFVNPDDLKKDSRYLSTPDPKVAGNNTYLTCSTQDANVGIQNQTLNTGWTSQEWILEPVNAADPNTVRIRNLWSNKYMTCNDVVRDNNYFYILSQDLQMSWSTQIWIKEPAKDKNGNIIPGRFNLRSNWIPGPDKGGMNGAFLYLTSHDVWEEGYKYSVYAKRKGTDSSGNPWNTQQWLIE